MWYISFISFVEQFKPSIKCTANSQCYLLNHLLETEFPCFVRCIQTAIRCIPKSDKQLYSKLLWYQKLGIRNAYGFWIAATSGGTAEQQLYWATNGKDIDSTYTNRARDEPNMLDTEDCVEFNGRFDGWNKIPCR